jgi:hypothetical protein
MDQQLIDLIQKTTYISEGDKSFLVESLPQMNSLEKLRLRGALVAGQAPRILQSLEMTRAKFFQKEAPKKPDILTKISNVFSGKKENEILAHSILTQPNILGGQPPQAIRGENIRPLQRLEEFYHPGQLSMLSTNHINFGLNTNTEQIIQNFLASLTDVFSRIDNVNLRRSYFMNFIESSLFVSYINTTLTAFRHPELQPPKIILNLLYQINQQYLNNKQFQVAAVISNHLRNLCGV